MIMPLSKELKVFYSYSHKDQGYRQHLENHLANLKRLYHLQTWFDRQIEPGDNWEGVLEEHLNSADLIFLLISADFMNSDYCYNKEMARALERHARGEAKVIPILVRPVHWKKAPFSHIQLLPTNAQPIKNWANPDKAYYNVVIGVERAIQDLLAIRGIQEERLEDENTPDNLKGYEEGLAPLERRSRNRKEDIDKKSWGWLAQENHTSQEEKDATNPLAAPGRTFRARRANSEEDSESEIVCVFAPASPRIAG